jgi:hypothetical protein
MDDELCMRPAAARDYEPLLAMMAARCDLMEQLGQESWRENIQDLSGLCVHEDAGMWVLGSARLGIIGTTTLIATPPPWGWDEEEMAQPAVYLYTTVTHPSARCMKPGALIAHWAVGRAAEQGLSYVSRGCFAPELAAYYQTQGFQVVREMDRKKVHAYLLQHPAEAVPDLPGRFRRTDAALAMLPVRQAVQA